MKKYILIIIIFSIGFTQCKKDKSLYEIEPDYILFGHFYGMCLGEECIEIFKLNEYGLFEDINDNYPGSESIYVGKYVKLNDSIFNLVKNIEKNIPEQIFNEPNGKVGIPDYGDGGGAYFGYSKNGKTQFWLIDQIPNNLPLYLQNFIAEINNNISIINN